MKSLILATNNNKKVKEMKDMLEGLDIEVFSLSDKNINIEVEEDGATFEENAKKKSVEIYKLLIQNNEENFYVLADDSGLEVDYLNGKPGIYSARYAGEHGNDYNNNMKLLKDMINARPEERNARFVCVLALTDSKGKVEIIRGDVEGEILEELATEGGFGYDPLFYYKPLGKSFAEISISEKNKVSHRGKALKRLKELL